MKTIIKKKKSQNKLLKTIKEMQSGEKKKKRAFKLLKYFIIVLMVLFISGLTAAIAVFAYYAKDLPDPNKLLERAPVESTKIFDRTGEHLLYEIAGEEKRTLIGISELPDYIKNAAVAIEDDNFYNHYGIDFLGIIRAFIKNIKSGGKSQGGSTITQQLVKNAILTKEKKYSRKIKEAILSIEIERKFTKNEILQMYLNEISYGSNVYGIEAASQYYFNKSAKDLSLSEAAALAAIPQATTYYSPYGSHPDKLEARRILVLSRMKSLRYISEEDFNAAKEAEPIFAKPGQGISAPHFVMYVKQILAEKFGEKEIESGGLRVYTTLDWEKQNIAEEAIKSSAESNENKYGAKNASLVAIDPKTGHVLAMVGSKNYFDLENDGNVNVALSLRQPGSSFKPFAYAAAFKKGYTPETILFDVPTDFNNYSPENYDAKYLGHITMRSALQMSKNVASVKTLYLAGQKETINLAAQLGITTLTDPDRYGLSLVLGGGEVRLLDIVSAYSVFANEGVRNPAAFIIKIENNKGEILEEFKENSTRVLDIQTSRLINDVLSDNAARTPAFGASSKLYLPERPAAAKTGTTNDLRDGWTIGYTPSLAAGVWAGNNDNSKMKGKAGGSSVAAPIWNEFMSRALKDAPAEQFNKPASIPTDKPILNGIAEDPTIYKIDIFTGKLANEFTPLSQIEERTLKQVHTILHYVDKNNPQGPAPENPANDPQYASWEAAVQAWALENGCTETPPSEIDDIHTEFNQPKITIASPQEGDNIPIGSSFYIIADIIAPLNIKEVNFFFDGLLIQSDPSAPFKASYTIPTDLTGKNHIIKAIIYDIADNSSSQSINIIVPDAKDIDIDSEISEIEELEENNNPDSQSSQQLEQDIFVSILTPENLDFPATFTIAAYSDNPIYASKISQVQLINKDTQEIIGSSGIEDESLSSSNQRYYKISFPQNASGSYDLYAKVIMEDGRAFESGVLGVSL